ncbi:MAG: Gfo/Idh/MocA family oxidoreductase, partial [Hyphomicrobiales bacterium]|nr:Gfo/Idh/MocA family oxidoreductase [Hyphomicrobiales bacterium]
ASCGDAAVFTDALELIGDGAVDAVVIASPDATHADLAVGCIEAGKPVLCEKPLGIGLDDAKRVLDAEIAHGTRLVQVGLMRVYDPPHRALKDTIDDGAIGRPLLFRGVHKNPRIPQARTAVDVIVNSAVHDIHSARWLMQDEVAFAYASHVVDLVERPETARLVLIQLTFRRGGLATIEVDADSNYGYEVSVEISGERGTLRTPPADTGPVPCQDGKASHPVIVDWQVRFDEAFRAEAEAWVRTVQGDTMTGATVWDGYVAMSVAEAAVRSLDSGKAEMVPEEPRPALYDAS